MSRRERVPRTSLPQPLVTEWLAALREGAGPLTASEGLPELAERLAALTAAGIEGREDPDAGGAQIAELLVRERLTSPTALRHAVLVLTRQPGDEAAVMAASLAATHGAAVLQVVLEQQKAVHAAALSARDAAERARLDALPASEGTTREAALEAELRHTATHDALTGLPNRSLFLQHLDSALAERDRSTSVAVMFLDLDGFKFVNDSRGHLAGDQVLVAVASRLAEVTRPQGALLARLAGDEFVVLLTGRPERILPVALGQLLLTALERPIDVAGQRPVTVRASVGVAQLPSARTNARELLRAADLALHAAKEDGGGQVVTHDPSRTARQISRFTAAANLPGVVERGELGLAYQPLVRLDTGALHGVEALLRWHHPRLGELSPRLFVGVAEETSLIVPIGRWVLDRALTDLAAARWPAVNINVSVRQLLVPTFASDVRRALADAGVAPSRLRLEVTESVMLHLEDAGPLAALHGLADDGVRIVMDDFGTGYSNLAALRRLPLHELKLAGTFLDGLADGGAPDPVDTAILRTAVDLAHTLGLTVTAEEVAAGAQDEWVRSVGCDVGQGWYYDDLAGATAELPCRLVPQTDHAAS